MLTTIPMSQINLHSCLSREAFKSPSRKGQNKVLGSATQRISLCWITGLWWKTFAVFVGFISLYPLPIQQSLLTDTVVLLFELVWLSGWTGIWLVVVTLEGRGFGESLQAVTENRFQLAASTPARMWGTAKSHASEHPCQPISTSTLACMAALKCTGIVIIVPSLRKYLILLQFGTMDVD